MALKWALIENKEAEKDTYAAPRHGARTKVPGGWFVSFSPNRERDFVAVIFYPDPKHEWDGNSLP